jgi:histidyl-tRNA synthetase
MEVAGLAGDDKAEARGIVLRAIDKLDKFGPEGVRQLLGEGRMDESGDFTKGAGLSGEQADRIIGFVEAKSRVKEELESGPPDPDDRIPGGLGVIVDDAESRAGATPALWNMTVTDHLMRLVEGSQVGEEGIHELGQIADLLAAQGYGPDRIVIDPSVVRGLGYYTGPVYEAELTFEITDETGRPRHFGSVAGGGRYDDLVKRFTGQEVPATGVSIGVDRLLAALRAKGRISGTTRGPVVVTVMDRERMADYQAMAAELRNAGIRAEVYLGNPKNFGNQLKYADKRQSPVAVIQGSDEAAAGKVQLKDLILGAKLAQDATLEEWKSQPAQTEVDRANLVAGVRALLDRHG